MSTAPGNESRERRERAPSEYPAKFPNHGATAAFARLLNCLLPGIHSHQAWVEALDNRAPISTIRQWRYGRRTAPPWAIELLAGKIEARAREAREAIASYQPPVSQGVHGLRALRRWAKEKAGTKAGPPDTA